MKINFVFPNFQTHSQSNPRLLDYVLSGAKDKKNMSYNKIGTPSGAIGILAALTPPGIEVKFVDDRIEKIDYEEEVDLVALSFFTPQATRAFKIADEYRKRRKTVIAGGMFPTLMPEETAKHVDAVAIGEGESIWENIINDFREKKLKKVYSSNSFFDLNKLPWPKWEMYFEKENNGYQGIDYVVQLMRGCPMNCFFCTIPVYMKNKIRFRMIDKIMIEMERLKEYGKTVSIVNDILFFPFLHMKDYLSKLLSAIAKKDIGISCMAISLSQISWIDKYLFSLLKKINIMYFYLVCGFDSFSRKVFSNESNKIEKQRAVGYIKKIQDMGIEPYVSIAIGNDMDDASVFDRILDFCEKAKINIGEFAIMTPYPKTDFWKQMLKQKRIIDTKWYHYNEANVVFRPAKMTPDELYRGYLYLWKEFYKNRKVNIEDKCSRAVVNI